MITQKRKTGITLTVLGFGIGNLNDAMMVGISNAGDGTYAVISSVDHAITYAHQSLLSGINFIARDMKIQVVFNPARVLAYRLLGYENRDIADEDFKNDAIDGGEVGAGHAVTALYEVVAVGGEIPQPAEASTLLGDVPPFVGELRVMPEGLVSVAVRWKAPYSAPDAAAHEVSAGLALADMAPSLDSASGDLQWGAAVAAFAELLKESPCAHPEYLPAITEIVAKNMGQHPERHEFEALMLAALSLMSH